VEAEQSVPHCGGNMRAHGLFVMELHLAFCGVNVHVHFSGIEFKEQTADRVTALHQGGVITFKQRVVQRAIFDRAAVHEQVLVLPRRARDARRAQKAPDAKHGASGDGGRGVLAEFVRLFGFVNLSGGINRQQPQFGAEQNAQPLSHRVESSSRWAGGFERRQLPDQPLVLEESEPGFGISQRCEGQIMLNVGALRFLAAQKFSASRQIVKQLSRLDAGAWGVTRRFDFQDFPAVQHDLRGFRRIAVAFPRGEREPADARDARQRFAAKPHGRNGGEVFRTSDLARRVAFETEQRVVLAHAGAVVGDADQTAAAGLDLHRNAAGLGVERILDQFLHDARRAFDHFARGNLVGHLFGEQTDAVHARKSKSTHLQIRARSRQGGSDRARVDVRFKPGKHRPCPTAN
jgi:hypothetical protein